MSHITAYLHKILEKSSFIKISCIIIASYLFISNFFKPHIIDTLLWKSWYGYFCKEIYIFIEHNAFAAWLSIVFFIIFSVYFSYKFSTKKYCKYIRLSSILLTIWILLDCNWQYASFLSNGDLRWWLAGICILPYGLSYYWLNNKKTVETHSNTPGIGLTTDKIRYKVDPTIAEYANEISKRIIATNAHESSYALGLEGSWGCGKSTFLSSLKKALPNKAVIMDFNPWLNISEKSLIQDYFDRLADTIYEHVNKELYSPISKYGNALLAIDNAGGIINTLKNLLKDYNKSSLKLLKTDITESLRDSDKKVYIFIDDLDRLDSEEMFEVLRLIRNTADFPNLIYITAYDREYIESLLRNKGIEKAGQYLEKIFNIEISLPKTEDNQLEREFIYELSDMMSSDINISDLPTRFIRGRLNSYRDVKRFARLLSVNYMFMVKNVGIDEFNLRDFFVLELLHYINHPLYNSLKNSINTSLIFKTERKGLYRFHLNDDLQKELEPIYGILDLTNYLFENETPNFNSLCFPNNYRRYFSFRLETEDISTAEFKEWLNSDIHESKQVLTKLISKTGKKRSLLFQFSTYDISTLSQHGLQCFFSGLIKLLIGDYKLKKEVKRILIDRMHPSENNLINSDEFFKWLQSELANVEDPQSMILISELFKSINNSDAGLEYRTEALEIDNLQRYLIIESPDVMDLLDTSKTIARIYANSIRWQNHYHEDEEGNVYEFKEGNSPLIDVVCNYFKQQKSSKKHLFEEKLTCFENYDQALGECYMIPLPEENANENIRSVFGNIEDYEIFMEQVFIK